MQTTAFQIGPLSCTRVSDVATLPTQLVVLCHGYGATSQDLVPLAEALVRKNPAARRSCFLFPQAPLSLASMGAPHSRAWWHLDPQALMARAQAGEAGLRALRKETFAGLPAARRQLRATIEAALQQLGLSYAQLVVGGFSQGAMLTMDLALRLEEAPRALVQFSGTLIDEDAWRRLAPARGGLQVLQSHGRTDPVLPYTSAVALKDLLEEAQCQVTFMPFAGGHTIPEEAMKALAALIGRPE